MLKYHLGLNYIVCEENSEGINYLKDVVSYLIKSLKYRVLYGHILLKSLNNLGIILSNRNELKQAKKYLDQSEQIYRECENDKNGKIYKDNLNDDKIEIYGNIRENEYTLTLFYLSQIYLMMNNQDKSSGYVKKTLQRQLLDKDNMDLYEWCRNGIGLSKYYVRVKQYRQAIHTIEAVSKVAPKFDKTNDDDCKLEADLERGWGQLYKNLLKDSYNVMENMEDNTDDTDVKNDSKSNNVSETTNLVDLESKLELNNDLNMFHGIKLPQPPGLFLSFCMEILLIH